MNCGLFADESSARTFEPGREPKPGLKTLDATTEPPKHVSDAGSLRVQTTGSKFEYRRPNAVIAVKAGQTSQNAELVVDGSSRSYFHYHALDSGN